MESNVLHYIGINFALLFKYEQGWLFVLIQEVLFYSKCKSPFTPKSVINKLRLKEE